MILEIIQLLNYAARSTFGIARQAQLKTFRLVKTARCFALAGPQFTFAKLFVSFQFLKFLL